MASDRMFPSPQKVEPTLKKGIKLFNQPGDLTVYVSAAEEVENDMQNAFLIYKTAFDLAVSALRQIRKCGEVLSGAEMFGAQELMSDNSLKYLNPIRYRSETLRRIDSLYQYITSELRDSPLRKKAQGESMQSISDGVEAVWDGEKLIVKFPMLGSKWHEVWGTNKSDATPKTVARRSTIYAAAITKKVQGALRNVSDADLKAFRIKTLTYIFVYPKSKESIIADSDNHDTKASTDAVLDNFPLTDSGVFCTMIYKTMMSDLYPFATYMIVKSGSDNIGTEDDLACFRNN